MNDYKDSVMIALLPITTDWSVLELPHLTLVYAGEVKDLKASDQNEMLKAASSIAAGFRMIQLQVMEREVFGDEEQVDVLRLRATPELMAMRYFVEKWNASKHPFNPHVTIGPRGSIVDYTPPAIAFDRISVCWGDSKISFWLRP